MDHFVSRLYGLFASATIAQAADGSMTIQSAPGRYIAWILAFIIVLPLALWCSRKRIGGRYAPGIAIASFCIPIVVVPGIAMESIRIAPDRIIMSTGFWFAPTKYQVPLLNLDEIIEVNEAVDQRDFSRNDTFWEFHYRGRDTHVLPLSNLFDANRGHVIDYLRRHGLRVRRP